MTESGRWRVPLAAYCAVVVVSVGLGLSARGPAGAQISSTAPLVQDLAAGAPVEREIKGGEQHGFRIQLGAGQFLRLVVEQKGIDVVVIVSDPTGAEIARMDSPNGDNGPEEVTLVSVQAGSHRVVVSALEPGAKPGRYHALLTDVRVATPQDRAFVEARTLSLEAAQGVQAGTPVSLRLGIEKYRLSAPLWLAAGRPREEAGAFQKVATLAHSLGDFVQSESAAAEAASKFAALGDARGQAIALTNFGNAVSAQRQFPKALEAHDKALALAESVKDLNLQASILGNAAQVYRNSGQLQKALEYEGRVSAHRRNAATATEPGPIEIGRTLTFDIAQTSLHRYRLELAAETFVHVRIEQLGANVEIAVFGPDGRVVAERNRPESATVPEPVSFIAGTTGAYVLEVMLEKDAGPGRYSITLRDRRGATAIDRGRVLAENAFAAGDRLYRPETLNAAVAQYKIALPIWRELTLPEWEASTLMQLAWVHLFRSEVDEALTLLNNAAPMWTALDDRRQGATTQNVIAVVNLERGNARNAIGPASTALRLSELTGDLETQSSALSNLASAHWMLGDRQKEMEFQARAIDVTRKMGNERRLGDMLHNRGVSLQTIGRFQEALLDLREALRIRHALLADRDEGGTLNAIAEVYRELGRLTEALDFHQRALALRRQTDDRAGVSQSQNNLGLLYKSLGEYDKARAAFDEALKLRREIKNRAGEANTLLNIAALNYGELKNYGRALEDLQLALTINRELDTLPGQASVLRHLGRVHELMGQYQLARSELEEAVELGRQVRNDVVRVDSLKALAVIDVRQGLLADALAHLQTAIGLVESGRKALFGDTFRSAFMATNDDLNSRYIDVLMQLHAARPSAGHDQQALIAAERFRARSLLDSLQEARVNLSHGLSSALIDAERSLRQRLDVAARQQASLTTAKDAEKRAAADRLLNDLLTEYHELRAQIHAASPRLAALDDAGSLSVNQIQTEIVDRDTVLLEYSLGSERSYLWLVTPTEVRSFVLPRRAEIETLARRVHELLTARNRREVGITPEQWRTRIARSQADLQPALTALSQAILAPAAALLPGKRLLVVASGALQYVPFAVLPMPGRTTALVTTNEVVTLPSASTLAALRARPAGQPRPTRAVAVLADPVFDGDDGRLSAAAGPPPTDRATTKTGGVSDPAPVNDWQAAARGTDTTFENGRLPRLRYSRDEADAIQKLARPDDRLVALDFAASRTMALSDQLRDYRIIHLAAHGFVNSDFPELSGIALSMVDERGQPVDGFLRLHQIYGLTLPVDLVVLSACQTALGKDVRGEGIVGLTRGFMYAGAARVVSTLWKVDDQATAELMKVFYEGMLGPKKLRPAEALRAAQLAVSKNDRWRDPYHWAGFTLQGEWR